MDYTTMAHDNQSRRAVLKKAGVAVGTTGLLAGCTAGGSDTPTDAEPMDTPTATGTATGTPTPEPTLELNLGVPAPNETGIPTWYGLREVAKEFNLDVTLNVLADTNILLQAMLSGQTEGSRDSMLAIMPIIDQGKPMKYLFNTQRATDYVLVGGPDFDSLDDLVNQNARLGAASDSLRSFTTLQVVVVLMQNGVIDAPEDILDYIVPVGYSSSRMTALINGNIDVSPQHWSQWLQIKEDHPDMNLLSVFGEEIDVWPQIGYYSSPTILEEKREEWVRALMAVSTATQRINEDYQLYRRKVRKYTPGGGPENEALRASWEFFRDINYHPADGAMSKDTAQFLVDLAKRVDIVSDELTVDEVIDTSIVEEALDRLG